VRSKELLRAFLGEKAFPEVMNKEVFYRVELNGVVLAQRRVLNEEVINEEMCFEDGLIKAVLNKQVLIKSMLKEDVLNKEVVYEEVMNEELFCEEVYCEEVLTEPTRGSTESSTKCLAIKALGSGVENRGG
jgi:hypothetical protein